MKNTLWLLVMAVFVGVLGACKQESGSVATLFPVEEGGKWGYIDSTGEMIIAPQFANAFPFHEGKAWVLSSGTGFEFGEGMSNTYNFVEARHFGTSLSGTGVVFSCIDAEGKKLFDTEYNGMKPFFNEGYTPVYKAFNESWGFSDATGKQVVDFQFEGVGFFSNGWAKVETGDFGECNFIDKTGKFISDKEFDSADDFSEGLAAVKVDTLWGYIDATGKMTIPPQFQQAKSFSDGLAQVVLDTLTYFIDNTGNQTIKIEYDAVDDFSEGLARVLTGAKYENFSLTEGKYGFIDKTGKMVIEPQFEIEVSTGMFSFDFKFTGFSNGLALVKQGGKYGFIDKTGKMVIEAKYENAGSFCDGLARAKLNGKWQYINKQGSTVWEKK